MRISINGKLRPGVVAKDVALYLMAKLTTSGATGFLWNMPAMWYAT